MGSFAREHWPRLRGLESSPFSGDCALVESELWHDRATAEVHRFVVDWNGDRAAYYFKRHKTAPERAAREYRALVQLNDHFAGRDDLGVVEPVVLIEDDAALVTAEFLGDEVRDLVRRGARIGAGQKAREAAIDAVRAVGGFIREMQRLDVPREHQLEPFLAWVGDDLSTCLATRMLEGPTTAQIRTQLAWARRYHANHRPPVVAVNSDTKLWNFLVDPSGRLRALDFVGIHSGMPAHDFARLWVGVDWQRIFPDTSDAAIDEIQRALLDSIADYELHDPELFRFYRLCVALRAAAFYTSIRRDKYRRKLRNVVGFPLIRRYYRDLVRRCLRSVVDRAGGLAAPRAETVASRVAVRAGDYFPEIGAPVELLERPFSEASTYPLHRFAVRGPTGEREIIVKIAPSFAENNEPRTEYENLERLAPALARADAPVCAPRALDIFADLDAVVTELVPHQRFSDWLLATNHYAASAASVTRLRDLSGLAGQLLALIHAETAAGEVAVGDSELARDIWLFLELAFEHGLPHQSCDAVGRFIADLPLTLAGLRVPRALAHGDYGPQNLGITRDPATGTDGLVVFDLQRNRDHVIYGDIAYYLVTLETINPLPRHPMFSRRRALSLRDDFIAGYFGRPMSPEQRMALHLYYLKNLIQRLHKQSANIARTGSWVRREAFNRGWLRRGYPAAIERELDALRRLVAL